MLGVEPSSPAARAGLLEGDVILQFGSGRVKSVDDLHRRLTEDAVGKPALLGILRRDETLDLEITPGEALPAQD